MGGWVVWMLSSSCCWSLQIPGETSQEVGLAGRKTLESVKAVSCRERVVAGWERGMAGWERGVAGWERGVAGQEMCGAR